MSIQNYKISFGGKEETIQGVNLKSALEKYGFTNINIVPLWRGRSNGKYKAYCSETTLVMCEWVEKVKELENLRTI